MKGLRKILVCFLLVLTVFGTVQVSAADSVGIPYEDMIEAYLDGRAMESEFVAERQRIGEKLGLTEYQDEDGFLTVEYQNEQQLGRAEPIVDPELDVLVEMGTREDELAVLMMSMVRPMADTSFATGDTVSVKQKARISGAGNGYFTISGAASYGYCAQNSKDFWSNDTSKSGKITVWNNKEVRKALYYGPGGPGYSDNYYGSKGADMDHVTFAIGQINGDTANNTKATKYRDFLEGKSDPLSKGYRAFKVDIASPYQDVAFLAYVPTEGTLQIKKRSQYPELTDNNSCYSLEGATYAVYSSSALTAASKVGTLTTNANGNSSKLTLKAGTYYVKETKAPPGFALDSDAKKVTVTADENTAVTFKNLPQMDPVGILLGKVDAETNANKPAGSASLQGAQYTVKFYGVQLANANTDPAKKGHEPLRTWVFKTNKNGFSYYSATYLVSGDDLYLSPNDTPSLPIGTVTIQETKAPEGYLLNPTVYVRQVTSEGSEAGVETYNYPVVPEQALKLDLVKVNTDGEVLPGAEFTHTKPDGTTEVFVTDTDGKISVQGLEYGVHTIRETKAPEGYRMDSTVFEFTVKTNNKITGIQMTKDGEVVQGIYDYEVTEEGNLSLTLMNEIGLALPATGAKDTILLILIAALFLVIGSDYRIWQKIIKKNSEGDKEKDEKNQ